MVCLEPVSKHLTSRACITILRLEISKAQEFEEGFYGEIRDPLLGDIKLYRYELELINSSPFQRLRGLRQLPGCDLVYPSACHTRFSHSLGVLEIANRISINSVLNLDAKDRRLLRIAALLHDIEEPPYYNAILHEDIIRKELLNLKQKEKIEKAFDECLQKKVSLPVSAKEVIDVLQGYTKPYLKTLINCEVGANRLDYLQRDAYFCGVKYGRIDDRIFSSFDLIEDNLVLNGNAIPTAEDILYNLYQMKIRVYDHKVVRSVLSLVRDAFRQNIRNHTLRVEEIFDMSDDDFLLRLGPAVTRQVRSRKIPKLVYELNTFSLNTPILAKKLDKVIRDRQLELIRLIAERAQIDPKEIRIEPIELRRLGAAEPIMVLYGRKDWKKDGLQKENPELRSLASSSRIIREWSEFFYEQWRVFIFCSFDESWDISRIDNMREEVAKVCDELLGFVTTSRFQISRLPELNSLYEVVSKTGEPKSEISRKILNLSAIYRESLKAFLDSKKLSTTDVSRIIKRSRTTTSLILNNLSENNLLVADREGRFVYFSLAANVEEVLTELGFHLPEIT